MQFISTVLKCAFKRNCLMFGGTNSCVRNSSARRMTFNKLSGCLEHYLNTQGKREK